MSESDSVIVHERLTKLEVNLDHTINTVKNLANIVERQGKLITRAIIVSIVLISIGILFNGGLVPLVETIKDMTKIFS